jgi:hypothetical protein
MRTVRTGSCALLLAALATAVSAAPGVAAPAAPTGSAAPAALAPAAADVPQESPDIRIVNSYNGARMADLYDHTDQDEIATAERSEGERKTEHWHLDRRGDGTYALRNLGNSGRCLQTDDGKPTVEKMYLRKCDGSRAQAFGLTAFPGPVTVWMITPVDNQGLAVTEDNPGNGTYSDLYLRSRALPSADRTWMLVPA